jgi:adenylate cyclase
MHVDLTIADQLTVWVMIALCCVIAVIPTFVLLVFKNRLALLVITLLTFLGVGGWWWAIQQYNLMAPVFYLGESILVGLLVGIFLKMIYSSVEKDFLRAAFSQFVSEDMLRELLRDPNKLRLTSKEYEITVLFLDIRGFTAFSEKKSPAIVVTRLNELLDIVTKVIIKHDGTVDKYIGDAVMAMWGAPAADKKQATKACQAALEIREQIEKETDFKVGIGLNFGKAIIGNIGSSKRFDYTAIGDTVNTASRIEGLTKTLGQNILISEAVMEKVKAEKGSFNAEDLGQVLVKGKNQKLHIFGLQ